MLNRRECFLRKQRMSKSDIPFEKLFKYVSPKDFVSLFKQERPQTIAFLLSFSPRRNYVKKVIHLFDNQERIQYPDNDVDALENRTSYTIREYLQRCQEDLLDQDFVYAVEEEVKHIIAGYEDLSDFKKLRKRLFFKHPKILIAANKNLNPEKTKSQNEYEQRLKRFKNKLGF